MSEKAIVDSIISAIADNGEKKQSTRMYATAHSDGTVTIDGASDRTPVGTTSSVKEGDRVLVDLSGHTATIVGNVTAPSTDDTVANEALDAAHAAGANASYFWHDDTGAHISDSPNSLAGAHVDIDSDSVDISNGSDKLMSITSSYGDYGRIDSSVKMAGGKSTIETSSDTNERGETLYTKLGIYAEEGSESWSAPSSMEIGVRFKDSGRLDCGVRLNSDGYSIFGGGGSLYHSDDYLETILDAQGTFSVNCSTLEGVGGFYINNKELLTLSNDFADFEITTSSANIGLVEHTYRTYEALGIRMFRARFEYVGVSMSANTSVLLGKISKPPYYAAPVSVFMSQGIPCTCYINTNGDIRLMPGAAQSSSSASRYVYISGFIMM